MPITRFNCVHCGAPLKTSAELTSDKRILCPKCETIFPVPAHLLRSSSSPGGTITGGPDITSGVGAESPRVKLVGMEDILGPEPTPTQAQSEPPPSTSPPESPPRAVPEPEPWEEELAQSASPPPAPEEKPTAEWSEEEGDVFSEEVAQTGGEVVEASEPVSEAGAVPEEVGEEAYVEPTEPEEIDFGQEPAAQKSRWWLWLVLLLLVLAGGLTTAWYLGWLDPVLQAIGLGGVSPGQPTQPHGNVSKPVQTDTSASSTPAVPGPSGTQANPPSTGTGTAPGKTAPGSAQEIFDSLEKLFREAPARSVAGMQCWPYVPQDANLVVCLNLAELTQHPAAQQLFRRPEVQQQTSPLPPALDPADIAEVLICLRLNWAQAPNSFNEKEVLPTLVIILRSHRPVDRQKFLQEVKPTLTDWREEKIGEQIVYFGTNSQGQSFFLAWLSPEILVTGAPEAVKSVPGLGSPVGTGLPKDWEPLAQQVGNAQLAVIARNVDLKPILTSAPLPPELQQVVPLLEKIQGASAKLEFLPRSIALQLQVGLGDAAAAKQLASLALEAYQQALKPALAQFAALAPDLVQDVEKSLQIGSDEAGAATVRLEASYPAIGNALQAVLKELLGGLMAKPMPIPVKP